MPLFSPTMLFTRVTAITPQHLQTRGIQALILDVDNTLTGHGSQKLPDDIAAWLEEMRAANVPMMICSNNVPRRVAPFAARIGLPFRAFCCKPSPLGLRWARLAFGLQKKQVALVGDQIFTDALGANLYGIQMLLVQPIYEDKNLAIRCKRFLEKPVLARYYRRGGQLIGAADAEKNLISDEKQNGKKG